MTTPRYLTEPKPVAVVPDDKMYQWILVLRYAKLMLAERTAVWYKYNVLASDQPLMIRDDLEDMLMFMYMSYSNYCDWLGMTSPFIDKHKPAAASEVQQGGAT